MTGRSVIFHDMRILLAIYSPPEYYPPLLNVIRELSGNGHELVVITRNIRVKPWGYPDNVRVLRTGQEKSIQEFMGMSYFKKIGYFQKFLGEIRNIIRNEKPVIWMANDSIPLLAFHILLGGGIKKPEVYWYHSHDLCDISAFTKFSVGWWSAILEKSAMKKINLFTLPSAERLSYFENRPAGLKTLVVPNYPSGKYFSKYNTRLIKQDGTIRMIYQGSLSWNHGFEELIPLLNEKIDGKPLFLTLIGPIDGKYKQALEELANMNHVSSNMEILTPVPYEELAEITLKHHIGLAIHKPVGLIYNTAGTASNKIYEYAALGLPVILFDDPHYRQYLSGYSWAGFTDCTPESLRNVISGFVSNHESLSMSAKKDFSTSLNFEAAFRDVNEYLSSCV